MRALTDEQRFAKWVEKTDSCWLWTGVVNSKGYGLVSVKGRKVLAHRWSYTLLVGPIPEGKVIDHVAKRGCTSKACVNPAHLEPVTQGQNLLRGMRSYDQRTTCLHGHDLTDPANWRFVKDGTRRCRQCGRDSTRRWKAKQ